jgi:hypothetical protein
VIPVAGILMIAAVATILTVLVGKEAAPQKNVPAGALDGTYAVQYAAATMPDGQPYNNAPGGRETWAIQSACGASTCVATASKVSGSESTVSTMVLDKVNGGWTGVSAVQGTCQNAATEFWETMSLQPQPDGTLTGDFVVRSTTSCARKTLRPMCQSSTPNNSRRGCRRRPRGCAATTKRPTQIRTAVSAPQRTSTFRRTVFAPATAACPIGRTPKTPGHSSSRRTSGT